MADPSHIFSDENSLWLDAADVRKNERMIREFCAKNGKLWLVFPETFKEEQLSALSELLSILPEKQKLQHFWYVSHSTCLGLSSFLARLVTLYEMSDDGFETMEKLILNKLDASTAIYLTY